MATRIQKEGLSLEPASMLIGDTPPDGGGYVSCPNCGRPVADGVVRCAGCGMRDPDGRRGVAGAPVHDDRRGARVARRRPVGRLDHEPQSFQRTGSDRGGGPAFADRRRHPPPWSRHRRSPRTSIRMAASALRQIASTDAQLAGSLSTLKHELQARAIDTGAISATLAPDVGSGHLRLIGRRLSERLARRVGPAGRGRPAVCPGPGGRCQWPRGPARQHQAPTRPPATRWSSSWPSCDATSGGRVPARREQRDRPARSADGRPCPAPADQPAPTAS